MSQGIVLRNRFITGYESFLVFFIRVVESIANGKKDYAIAILKALRSQPIISTHDIINNYGVHISNQNSCPSLISLLWNPLKLIECEASIRNSFQNNPDAREAYMAFDRMSIVFQRTVFELITPIAVNKRICFF